MRVLPILFNTEMVRAIIDGRKSCTRRIVNPQPKSRLCYTYAGSCKSCIGKWTYPSKGAHEFWGEEYKLPKNITDEESNKRWTPPYHTDDILYVRETWCDRWLPDGFLQDADRYGYKANGIPTIGYWGNDKQCKDNVWIPSIHMPKEAARIWLKVTDVRVERLQDMNGLDVLKEGVNSHVHKDASYFNGNQLEMFSRLWDSTVNKSDLDIYGWNANPYVWIIEFERCEKPEESET